MLLDEQRNTNLGVGLGIFLFCVAKFSPLETLDPSATLVVWYAGLGFYLWGCANYARGKGYSSIVGLLGIIPVLGLIILVLLRDLGASKARPSLSTRDRVALAVALACIGLVCWKSFQKPAPFSAGAAQRLAMKSYPQLGVANSPLNREFVARYKKYQKTNRDFFKDQNWPITLARESQAALDQTGR